MAKQYTSLDLNHNVIKNGGFEELSSAPISPHSGQQYFDTVLKRNRYWDGLEWINTDAKDAVISGEDIVTAINESTSIIDIDNLPNNIIIEEELTNILEDYQPLDADLTSIAGLIGTTGFLKKVAANTWALDNTEYQPIDPDLTMIAGLVANSGLLRKTAFETWTLDTNNYATVNQLHGPVTVLDTATIDLNLNVQELTATVRDDSIDNTKLLNMAPGTIKGNNAVGFADPKDLTVAETKLLLAYTKSDIGLANVTNDAQIKKIASSTIGNVPIWNATTGDILANGYTVETVLAGSSTALVRADAAKAYIDNLISANDVMVYKGTIGVGGSITILPTTYQAGWSYKVITAGIYAGQQAEIGDLIIATVDRYGTGNLNSDWNIIQTNLDGAVIGPTSSVSGNFATFNGSTGKLIADSGYSPLSFEPAIGAKGTAFNKNFGFTIGTVLEGSYKDDVDGEFTGVWNTIAANYAEHKSDDAALWTYVGELVLQSQYDAEVPFKTDKYAANLTGISDAYIITHNLDTMDVVVSVREIAAPHELIYTTVEITSANTITIKFADVQASDTYRVVVIG